MICELFGMLCFFRYVLHFLGGCPLFLFFLYYIWVCNLLYMQLKPHEDLMACKSNYSNQLNKEVLGLKGELTISNFRDASVFKES